MVALLLPPGLNVPPVKAERLQALQVVMHQATVAGAGVDMAFMTVVKAPVDMPASLGIYIGMLL